MLHILLLILKIIGIILAVILGILVLLFCIVLFVPVRYRIEAQCDGTLDGLRAEVKVTWLCHIIEAVFRYKERKADYNVRAAWIKFGKESGEAYEESKEINRGKRDEETLKEAAKESPEISERDESPEKEACERPGLPEKTESKLEETDEDVKEEHSESQKENEGNEKNSTFFEKIKKFFSNTVHFFERLFDSIRNIKCTFQKFCDKINLLLEKKDKLAEFIEDETHRTAFLKAKSELFKLIRRLKPSRFVTDVTYGFNDPYITGQVLAGLSILYPFWGKQVKVTPDFERRRLEGTLFIKGRIRMIHLIVLLWNLVWSREIRRTYKDIRKFHV